MESVFSANQFVLPHYSWRIGHRRKNSKSLLTSPHIDLLPFYYSEDTGNWWECLGFCLSDTGVCLIRWIWIRIKVSNLAHPTPEQLSWSVCVCTIENVCGTVTCSMICSSTCFWTDLLREQRIMLLV